MHNFTFFLYCTFNYNIFFKTMSWVFKTRKEWFYSSI